jgi:hypothetical protein
MRIASPPKTARAAPRGPPTAPPRSASDSGGAHRPRLDAPARGVRARGSYSPHSQQSTSTRRSIGTSCLSPSPYLLGSSSNTKRSITASGVSTRRSRGSTHRSVVVRREACKFGIVAIELTVQIVPFFMTGFESVRKSAEEAEGGFGGRRFFRSIGLAIGWEFCLM